MEDDWATREAKRLVATAPDRTEILVIHIATALRLVRGNTLDDVREALDRLAARAEQLQRPEN